MEAVQFKAVLVLVVEEAANPVGTLGTAEHVLPPPPPPPPDELTPEQERNTAIDSTMPKLASARRHGFRLGPPSPLASHAIAIPGKTNKDKYRAVKRPFDRKIFPFAEPVAIDITMSTAELLGVIGPEGLKRHRAPEGSPEQDSVIGAENETPTGRTES